MINYVHFAQLYTKCGMYNAVEDMPKDSLNAVNTS